MKKILNSLTTFLQKYPTETHIALLVWNAFITSWATKLAVPLEGVGIPISINASVAVSWVQAHAHIPTSVIGILTLVLNSLAYYVNWKKTHQSEEEKIVTTETPTATITEKTVETKDVQEK